jgi:hypothetical protein
MSVFRESLPSRKLWEKALPWVAALVLAAGVTALIIKLVPSTNGQADRSPTQHPTIVPTTPPKTVKLTNAARDVAGRFILTAVKRRNLAEAWKLSGPQIRQDLTYKQWLTGNIPVVPYLTPTGVTPLKIDFSYKDHALVEVAMVPKQGVKGDTELFWLELKHVGKGSKAHWLVWSWTPNLPPAIPANSGGG